ncbi:MAG: methyltransferase domain-containing protein [Gammaproteobacteria bacterium]|nr:methyltransferase domain-containing protein [Gammaproteobacteria bacterium]
MGKRKRSRDRARRATMAEQADRHELYELSVQSVEDEMEFLEETYAAVRGRKPRILREDFCGTAGAACQWVKANRLHHAIGVDIDADVLEWGRQRNVVKLSEGERKRLRLLCDDVVAVRADRADLVIALNFSYWVFKTRESLRDYFSAARRGLADDGLLIIDVFGGSDAFKECEEKTRHKGFTYVWDQASYEPVSGDYVCHIHFRFPDGSRLEKAFSYAWRLWTLPEIRELLDEAGFRRCTVYWQGEDEDGEASGEFSPVERGEADPAWIAYVVAER